MGLDLSRLEFAKHGHKFRKWVEFGQTQSLEYFVAKCTEQRIPTFANTLTWFKINWMKRRKKTVWTWEFGLFFSAARSLKVVFLFSSSFWSTENKSWKKGLLKNAVIWRKPWKQFKPKCHFLPVSTHLNSLSLVALIISARILSLSLLQSLCQHINTLTKTISISASPYLGMFLKKSFYIFFLSLSLCHCHTLQQHQSFFCFCK